VRVELNGDGLRRWRSGHPWIFRDQVARHEGGSGDLVEVAGPEGRPLGTAFLSTVSKIALRRFSRGPLRGSLAEELRRRLAAAARRRDGLARRTEALRLVASEADGLPGLIVDRYGPVLVVQALTAGMDRLLGEAAAYLEETFAPRMILARNDPAVRGLEGLPREVRLLSGERLERLRVDEEGLAFTVEPFLGQKTGLYLDQRPARLAVRGLARGRRVLDLFCYQGGFALNALAGGAAAVRAVDASGRALQILREDAAEARLPAPDTVEGNVFDLAPGLVRSGERFDLIVLDPPAFARSREEAAGAERGYRELNRRAVQLLAPGGALLTCSCSYNMPAERFLDTLRRAAADAGRPDLELRRLAPGEDHPLLLGLPESDYLKAFLLIDPAGEAGRAGGLDDRAEA